MIHMQRYPRGDISVELIAQLRAHQLHNPPGEGDPDGMLRLYCTTRMVSGVWHNWNILKYLWVLWDDTIPIAVSALMDGEGFDYIYYCFVQPGRRRQGYATQLLKAAFELGTPFDVFYTPEGKSLFQQYNLSDVWSENKPSKLTQER